MFQEVAAQRGDLEFVPYQIPYNENIFAVPDTLKNVKAGIEQLESQIDFWWIAQDPIGEDVECLKAIAANSRHPIVCGTNADSTKNGALVYIMTDAAVGSRETAAIVDQVLKGTPIGTIPVHSPAKIDFGVNLSTAVKMEVAIPSDLLELAGTEIIR